MIKEKKYIICLEDNTNVIGTLYVSFESGKEIHSFEFSDSFLKSDNINKFVDPDLMLSCGRQYPAKNRETFSFLEDSLPDRWGRKLILRDAHKRDVNIVNVIDYLTGISDIYRTGAIRIMNEDGEYLSQRNTNIPPILYINKLEQAAIKVDDELSDEELDLLLSPGSSLGGARPKCNVFDNDKAVYIAKFPNKNDDFDVGAMEMVVHDLALLCDINVPEAKLMKLSKYGSTYLSKRFDRNYNKRIHYASALCLLGAIKGDDIYSYLDIASLIISRCQNVNANLKELYKRVVFNVAINNTDDHLRNHGFIFNKNGWTLSPAFDLTIGIHNKNHVLKIDETHTSLSLKEVAKLYKKFRLTELEAQEIVSKTISVIKENFDNYCHKYSLKNNEIEMLKKHFVLE